MTETTLITSAATEMKPLCFLFSQAAHAMMTMMAKVSAIDAMMITKR